MTEDEWLSSTDPRTMYDVVEESLRGDWPHNPRTERKRVFFGAACCRLVWPWIVVDDRCRRVVERMETQFDVPMSQGELERLSRDVEDAADRPDADTPHLQRTAASLVLEAANALSAIRHLLNGFAGWGHPLQRRSQVADLIREIVGNPFRSVRCDYRWQTSTVLALAEGIHADRAFDRMPIFADALEDAGCDNADILSHCRGDGPHVRGCWVVDLVLGKS
jgi:hypothetical protein